MTTVGEERSHWCALSDHERPEAWECGEQWATAPTVGWLMVNRPKVMRGPCVDLGCGRGRLAVPMALAYPGREVLGIDIAAHNLITGEMGNFSRWIGDGRSLPFVDDSVAYVWSVSMFQHVDFATVVGYVMEAGRVLVERGRLAVQFVEGGGPDGPYHHSHRAESVLGAARDAGLSLVSMERGWLLPQWTWMVAEKRP